MTASLRIAWSVAAHDLARELRRPVASSGVLVFGGSALVVLRLALAGDGRPTDGVLAGALWVLLVFAAVLGTARAWSAEREAGSFDALLSAPAPRWAIHAGKVLTALVTTLALHLLLVLLYVAMFAGPSGVADQALLVLTVVLADLGLASVGVLVAGLGMRANGRDLLGAVLFLPLAIPLVIAATALTLGTYGDSGVETASLLAFVVAYDLTFLAAGCVAFPELAVE